jgi:hypothetical protein
VYGLLNKAFVRSAIVISGEIFGSISCWFRVGSAGNIFGSCCWGCSCL